MSVWLPDGKYFLARQVVTPPAHHVVGAAAVVVAASHAALGSPPAPLTTPLLWLTGFERWLVLAGLSVALGGLAGRGLARHYKGSTPGPLPDPWVLRGALGAAAASALLLITSVADPGLAVRLAQPRAMGLPADSTAVIAGAEVVLFAFAALLARFGRDSGAIWPLAGAVVAESVRSHAEGMIPAAGAALTFCHLLPSVMWAGMLFYVLRAAFAWRAHPPAMQGIMRQYGTAAAWLLAVIAVTGVFSAVLLVPLGSLLTTSYGKFLILKAVLVAVAAGLAVGGRVWLRSHPRAGAGPALATRLEVGALAAVLAIAALLTVLHPPAKPIYANAEMAPAAAPVQAARQAGGVTRAAGHVSDMRSAYVPAEPGGIVRRRPSALR